MSQITFQSDPLGGLHACQSLSIQGSNLHECYNCESTRAYTCSLRCTCFIEDCWGPVLEEKLEVAFANDLSW